MSDTTSTAADTSSAETAAETAAAAAAPTTADTSGTSPGAAADATANAATDAVAGFSERYSEILGRANELLDQVDWSQMGRIGKAVGILVVVIVAQILIKGVLDTLNLLPVVPGLLELLGLVVVGQWSWKNLTTGEKRQAVVSRIQHLRSEYLG